MSTQTLSPTEAGPRTRAKRDAVRHFEEASPSDVDALIENARESYHAATAGTSSKYWLAYWGRLIELRREAYQRSRPRPGRWTA